MKAQFRTDIEALRDGRISFTQFQKNTHSYWLAMSRSLMRRWKGPIAVDNEDLIQEMMLAAWVALPKHDASRAPLDRYIRYNAVYTAKRWLHAQRGALRRSDHSPSRHPVVLSTPNAVEIIQAAQFAEPEELTHHEVLVRAAHAYTANDDQLIFEAVVRSRSTKDAADELYAKPEVRLQLKLDSKTHARQHVMAVTRRIAAAM